MNIEIDSNSGFCPGVTHAIAMAEEILDSGKNLYCLGDIVHNTREVERLTKKGLRIIGYNEFSLLHNSSVLIRAHGEPPSTYKIAQRNNINLIDASCKVVLSLQKRIRNAAHSGPANLQVVIFGKKNHAEVNGLVGQVGNKAVVVSNMADLDEVDFSKPVHFFSQTTQSPVVYRQILEEASKRAVLVAGTDAHICSTNSICPLVLKREKVLAEFADSKSIVIFVSDIKSSNGKMLFELCVQHNPRSYFVSRPDDVDCTWFSRSDNVGICGATSTPQWLMQEVSEYIEQHCSP